MYLDPDPIWFVGALLEGSRTLVVQPLPGCTAGDCDEVMDRVASRPLPFNLPSGNPNLYRAAMSLRVRCATSVGTSPPGLRRSPQVRGPHCVVCVEPGRNPVDGQQGPKSRPCRRRQELTPPHPHSGLWWLWWTMESNRVTSKRPMAILAQGQCPRTEKSENRTHP